MKLNFLARLNVLDKPCGSKIYLKKILIKKIKFKIKVVNKACIAIAQDTNSKRRCKHIDIIYKYIQEKDYEK